MAEQPQPPASEVICTPDRRLRVFISSTLGELAGERAAVRAAIEGMHLTPVLFELGARPHPPRTLYAAYIEQSDVFVGIYWERYGWLAPGATVSGVEDEYELASALPRLLYVREPAADRDPALTRLITRLESEGRVCYRTFSDAAELGHLVARDLAVLLTERFATTRPAARLVRRPTLPVPLTPTIGRRREVAALTGLLRKGVRLVTITGTGGVGKSRVAIAAALELARDHPDDVYFVALAALTDARLVMATVAEHVGVRVDGGSALDAVADHLRARRVVLVLDNFEHLGPAVAEVAALLDRCADLQVVVTSRHVLRIRGEHEFALAPLAVPAPGSGDLRKSDAVKLFMDRAAAVRHDFALTAANRQSVAELCRKLDGLPLALELAAARLRLLEPDELLSRLGTRLDLLASAATDLPERQRALRATLDWSYDLLTPPERTLFARLSVFAGGATLAGAEAVCGDDELVDVVEVMASLLEKSMLVHLRPQAGPTRFQMLHVVRAYAWERLAARGETDAVRARHAAWFVDAVRTHPGVVDEGRFELFDVEVDNLRAALAWTIEQGDLAAAAVLARRLRPWWWLRGMLPEALEWLESAARMADRLGHASTERGWILTALGHSRQQVGRTDAATAPLRKALDLFTANDEAEGLAAARLALAAVLADQAQLSEAVAMTEGVLDEARRMHQDEAIEWASSLLGTFLAATGELDAARTFEEEACAAATRLRADPYIAMAQHQLAMIELLAGRTGESWRHLATAADIYRRTAHLDGVSYALEVAAAACLADHEDDDACAAASLARALHDSLRLPVWPVLRPLHDQLQTMLERSNARRQPADPPDADPARFLQRLCERHLPQCG